METYDVTNYQDEYIPMGYADILSEMLKKYSEDDLIELLCECETLLQTNDIYLKKLDERGFKRLYNLIIGIERKCDRRLRDNFQLIHKITLEVEKNILSRFTDLRRLMSSLNEKNEQDSIFTHQCICFLLQKINDHKRFNDKIEESVLILKWFNRLEKKEYSDHSDIRKILQITSDVYAITRGKCEFEAEDLELAINKLKLSNVEISPNDFAKEIIGDSKCLPLYIKDELNYNDTQVEISNYGRLICQVYDLTIDRNIQELSDARNETPDTLCLPLLEKSIKDNNISPKSALQICKELLDDMGKMNEVNEQARRHELKIEEQRKQEVEEKIKQEEEKQRIQRQQEMEDQKKHSLSLVSPVNWIECSLGGYVEDSFEPTNDYGVDKDNMEYVKKRVSSFSPAIIVKSDGISKNDLAINNSDAHIISLADFYFCLWYKNEKQRKNSGHIALIDYYKHELSVSCYSFDDTGKIRREMLPPIAYNRTKNHIEGDIVDGIKEKNVFLGIQDNEEIKKALFRIFKSEKYIDKKLGKLDIPFIDVSWRDSLRNAEKRREVIDRLYEFEDKVLPESE